VPTPSIVTVTAEGAQSPVSAKVTEKVMTVALVPLSGLALPLDSIG
jgi:hypothetical protein